MYLELRFSFFWGLCARSVAMWQRESRYRKYKTKNSLVKKALVAIQAFGAPVWLLSSDDAGSAQAWKDLCMYDWSPFQPRAEKTGARRHVLCHGLSKTLHKCHRSFRATKQAQDVCQLNLYYTWQRPPRSLYFSFFSLNFSSLSSAVFYLSRQFADAMLFLRECEQKLI